MKITNVETKNVFLFASILFRVDLHDKQSLIKKWSKKFGPSLYFYNPYIPMKNYYSKEMGDENLLDRFFLVSTRLYYPQQLVTAKLWSNQVEEFHQQLNNRTINIDVGRLSIENLQLATRKNFIHRVYLGRGVFSDLTLIYQGHSYVALNWTYPDYQEEETILFFNWVRNYLKTRLKYSSAYHTNKKDKHDKHDKQDNHSNHIE